MLIAWICTTTFTRTISTSPNDSWKSLTFSLSPLFWAPQGGGGVWSINVNYGASILLTCSCEAYRVLLLRGHQCEGGHWSYSLDIMLIECWLTRLSMWGGSFITFYPPPPTTLSFDLYVILIPPYLIVGGAHSPCVSLSNATADVSTLYFCITRRPLLHFPVTQYLCWCHSFSF